MNPVTLKSKDQALRAEELAPGIVHIQLSNFWARRVGFGASCYLVDEILIDCGFSNAGVVLTRFLSGRKIKAIYCTHNHEDHTGNCGRLAEKLGCPVYLRNPDKRWEEGVARLLPYRRLSWGKPDDYLAQEMPARISTGRRELMVIPTPGHSRTHVVFFEETLGLLFAGDLYVSGSASAIMTYENPYDSIVSLRTAAGLGARLMLNGHGLVTDDVSRRLREKADRIESAAGQVVKLHTQGLSTRQILRRVFANGHLKDWLMSTITNGEFSRTNFVRACIQADQS